MVSPNRPEVWRIVTGTCETRGDAKLGMGVGAGGIVRATSGLVLAKREMKAMKPARRSIGFIIREVGWLTRGGNW